MEFSHYQKIIRQLSFGKRLPEALYLHTCAIERLPAELAAFLEQSLKKLQLNEIKFDLMKFHLREFKISLLLYPTFWEDPFPELKASYTIDLITMKSRFSSYENSANPPILHRKETFLPPDHPRFNEFANLTWEVEEAGLFENLNRIGFKQNWLLQIKAKGYQLVNGQLQKISVEPENRVLASEKPVSQAMPGEYDLPKEIHRHRTAIDRNVLSAPMQSLYKHGFLDGHYSVFDFGCGKGDDLRELAAHGINATGWDPVFRRDSEKAPADIVNLGFIINVIENHQERRETLREAFSLAQKVLSVAVMLGSESLMAKFRPYGDGVVTSRGTFQKYYSQGEIRSFIEQTLEANAVAVGPGLFFVFRSQDDEQAFLAERQRRRFDWVTLSQREARVRAPIQRLTRYEKNQALIEDYQNVCLSLGRQCKPDEFEFSAQIRQIFGSFTKAWEHISASQPELFAQARAARIEDLLVYFGLNLFGRRKPYSHMPKSLQRDVQEFFGDYRSAIEQARALLFSVGSPQTIHQACILANESGIGHLDSDHSLQLHTSQINALPAVLRLYVGCATQLFGDVDKADLVKIHIQSGKVSLMRYDDFVNKPLPQLLERIKIKMREQQIDFFDYTTQPKVQLLYLKSRFIPADFPFYAEQKAFDEKLQTQTGFDFTGFGPPAEEVLKKIIKSF